jgi:hypothetical protein
VEEPSGQETPRRLLIFPVLLALLLAVSPILLFGDDADSGAVLREDLSEAQLETLAELDFARTPADVRGGMTALNQAFLLDSGSLVVAGTWEGSLELGNWSDESVGGRDLFVAELTADGDWSSAHFAGSSGEDSIALLSISGDRLSVWGRVNGEARFASEILDHHTGWSPTAFEAHLYIDEGWQRVWQIDDELLPVSSTSLWCGFA